MLIRFEVANFRSILQTAELSMVAVDRDRPAARAASRLGESLLCVAAIYGPNASGKTNVIAAMTWLREAVRDSLRFWDDGIPLDPFAFAGGAGRPCGFTIEYLIDGVRFEYVIEMSRTAVQYEALFHYPEKRQRRIFERTGEELELQRGLGALSGTRELLTPRTLALSIVRRFDEPLVQGFVRELLGGETLGYVRDRRRQSSRSASSSSRWFQDDASVGELPPLETAELHDRTGGRQQALALLQLADLGIDDVVVRREKVESLTLTRVRLIHRAGAERVPFELSEESEGTRTWFRLIGPVMNALRSGSALFFDELDASLHPTLSAELIKLFQDPATNPRGAQLIFTSHDTSLLNHLNRDEVWLTEKSDTGATRLGALAEYAGERVRRSQNLENAYLHGRFGALPDVDRAALLRALGLIA